MEYSFNKEIYFEIDLDELQYERLDSIRYISRMFYRFANPRYTCSFSAGFTGQIKNLNETRLTDCETRPVAEFFAVDAFNLLKPAHT